jgi:hypothetical protein
MLVDMREVRGRCEGSMLLYVREVSGRCEGSKSQL